MTEMGGHKRLPELRDSAEFTGADQLRGFVRCSRGLRRVHPPPGKQLDMGQAEA